MALKLNIGQINSAAKGNNDLRETLTGIYNELLGVHQQIGSAPIQKVDTAPAFSGPPPPSQLSVSGANGQFPVSITLPQSSGSIGEHQRTRPMRRSIRRYPALQQLTSAPE